MFLDNKKLFDKIYLRCLNKDRKNPISWQHYGLGLFRFGLNNKSIKSLLQCGKLNYNDEGYWQFCLGYILFSTDIYFAFYFNFYSV